MGCDIHSIVEVKENGVWRTNTDTVFLNADYREGEKDKPKEARWEAAVEQFLPSPADVRNYNWFSLIADVRNGHGFPCIVDPRGVPSDATEEWKTYIEDWGCDLHSKSWLTAKDFADFDWEGLTIMNGVIHIDEYEKVRKNGDTPNGWCGSISGPNIVTVEMKTADGILDSPKTAVEVANKQLKIYVKYRWAVNIKDWFTWHRENVIEPLARLAEKYEDARYVFAFDN